MDATLRYILSPARAAQVAKAVVQQYDREFSDTRIKEFERALAQIDRELNKLVDALIDAPKIAHQKIYTRMELLDTQKTELESDLARLKVAQDIRLTEPEVLAWLKTFRDGKAEDPDFQLRVIDTFINSVYVYDDRLIVFYNIRHEKKQVAFSDLPTASGTGTTSSGTASSSSGTASSSGSHSSGAISSCATSSKTPEAPQSGASESSDLKSNRGA